MSRGSYQRRVWITALQHNEGYDWHEKYMRLFAGCGPGLALEKFVNECERMKAASEKSKLRPNYCRRSTKHVAEERDYGEVALALNETSIDIEKDIPVKMQSYTVRVIFICNCSLYAFID